MTDPVGRVIVSPLFTRTLSAFAHSVVIVPPVLSVLDGGVLGSGAFGVSLLVPVGVGDGFSGEATPPQATHARRRRREKRMARRASNARTNTIPRKCRDLRRARATRRHALAQNALRV